jgi:putative Ca2+/H+ antiporter (TMEM165/GDT1 family)
MELLAVFGSTFLLVFLGELGDKTQLAAGAGALVNRQHVRIIFFASATALVLVAGLTVLAAGLVPRSIRPVIVVAGGLLLVYFGYHFFRQASEAEDGSDKNLYRSNPWKLFFTQFWMVFIAELGDKTQLATFNVSVTNQTHLYTVFTASATALVTVTLLTVWGMTKIPSHWAKRAQKIGAIMMVVYGLFMLVSEGPNVIFTFGPFIYLLPRKTPAKMPPRSSV